jgi:hypothetical protein
MVSSLAWVIAGLLRSISAFSAMTRLMMIAQTAQSWRLPLIMLIYRLGYGVLRPVSGAVTADSSPSIYLGTILRSVCSYVRRRHPYQRRSAGGGNEEDRHGMSVRLEYPRGGAWP